MSTPQTERPLGDRRQVRRGVEPGGEAVRARDLGRDPGGGALAVRAGHVDRGIGELRVVEVGRQREDAREVGDHARFLARSSSASASAIVHRGCSGVRRPARQLRLDRELDASSCSSAWMLPASRMSREAWLSRRSRSCVSWTVTRLAGALQRDLRERLLLAHRGEHVGGHLVDARVDRRRRKLLGGGPGCAVHRRRRATTTRPPRST